MRNITIKHHVNNSGTFVRNTRKSVPALLRNELNFLHNLPILVSLFNDNQGVFNHEVSKNCRDSYSNVNSFSAVSTKKDYKTARRVLQSISSRASQQGFTQGRLVNAIHSPILVKSQSGLVNTRELRDLHRLVCEERKRIRQFVFANSGGGRS